MILVDANLLLYAINQSAPQHAKAKAWLEGVLSGSEAVGLAWVVILAFLRVSTSPRVFESPLSPGQARAYVDEWLALPVVKPLNPGPGHWPVLQSLLEASGTAGNLTSDAHLGAMALEQGAVVHSADHDFRRFAGVRCFNPLG